MDKIHIFERILRRKQRLRLPSDVWLQNRKNLRYLMNYGIVQTVKIKTVITYNPVTHATHSTPWNAEFRFTEFF